MERVGKSKESLCYEPEGPLRSALISGFRSMKRLGVFMLPPGWDASPSQGYPQHYAGTHLYTWVERSNVRVKCLAQEHNTMSPARPRTRTTRSGVEHTNHEATAPPNGGSYRSYRSKTLGAMKRTNKLSPHLTLPSRIEPGTDTFVEGDTYCHSLKWSHVIWKYVILGPFIREKISRGLHKTRTPL